MESCPCVATDISNELLNLRLKVVGVVEEDQLVEDLKWSPKRPQPVSLECFLNERILLSFGSSRCQRVCLKVGIQD